MQKLVFSIWISLFSLNLNATLTTQDTNDIGMLIWLNEASQKVELLTHWGEHETFPSLGIGHFIWQPAGKSIKYAQQFPAMCQYLQDHGVVLPAWLIVALPVGAPWTSRTDFEQDQVRIAELRQLLTDTIDLQTNFIIEQFDTQCPAILATIPVEQQAKVTKNLQLLRATKLGTYALIDYLNFKGSGLNPDENKRNQGWGLRQVLINMDDNLTSDNATKSFAISAAQTLCQLIRNSAPEYGPLRYLNGWMQRISGYRDENVFNTIVDSELAKLDPAKITSRADLLHWLETEIAATKITGMRNSQSELNIIKYLSCVRDYAQQGAISAQMLRQCTLQTTPPPLPRRILTIAEKAAIASCLITNRELSKLLSPKI